MFSHIEDDRYYCLSNIIWRFVIPYKNNEEFVGLCTPTPQKRYMFKIGDKCKVRNEETAEWKNAYYVTRIGSIEYKHRVLLENHLDTGVFRYCKRADW